MSDKELYSPVDLGQAQQAVWPLSVSCNLILLFRRPNNYDTIMA